MGGAVIILFFLPWLDNCAVKSIRYRPDWHKYVYAVFVVNFVILAYLGTQPPSPVGERVSQSGHAVLLWVLLALCLGGAVKARSNQCLPASILRPTEPEVTKMKKLLRHCWLHWDWWPVHASPVAWFGTRRLTVRPTCPHCKTAPSCLWRTA